MPDSAMYCNALCNFAFGSNPFTTTPKSASKNHHTSKRCFALRAGAHI